MSNSQYPITRPAVTNSDHLPQSAVSGDDQAPCHADYAREKNITLRTAAYVLALSRIAAAMEALGTDKF
ncbi:hypothetical protein HJB55_32760 [Rhizobium lentis]|nr:hypothetical protein [Rhizobium lentis]